MINPPTDNLYKFCAILGLILIVFNSYYSFEMLSKTARSLIILNGEQKKYGYELKLHEKKAKHLNEELKSAVKFQDEYITKQEQFIASDKKQNLTKKEFKNLLSEIESYDSQYIENQKLIDSLDKITTKESELLQFKKIEMDTKYQLIEQENKQSDMYDGYLWKGIILGFILSFFGFYNWIRIQRIIDKTMDKLP